MAASEPFREALEHGGRLAAAMAAYPHAPRPWMDLSTGINPEPWRGQRASLDALGRLPDPARIAELEAVAGATFGVADPARVVATAGAETALRWLPFLLGAGGVEIVSPTYGGHERAWAVAGRQVRQITPEALAASSAEAVVLVNPNNPDGRIVARDALAEAIEARSGRGLWTIVDESFVETRPELSVAGLTADRLVVLRSFGKFYGLAGLRLGFMVAAPDVAARLRQVQGDWPVGAEAVSMGLRAYADTAWQARTRAELQRRAGELDGQLARAGLAVIGGTSLFRLVCTQDAAAVFDRLCHAGVLTRPFPMRGDWLRFGLPAQEDVSRLAIALRRVAA
ncbi:MAG: threonine-phosphate decarboxylase [Phenylobacterium zucineum]|nr:MAG: threonine-phosphate decarboxylase [Phenylobacterium zucineum]